MSKLQVDDIVNKDNTGSVGFSRGAVVTGVVTATGGSFSGNVTVGGVLTYEDVTNIDSVGIVTARTGIKVLAGGINAVGVVTATSFSGSGANLTGLDAAPSFSGIASGSLTNGQAAALTDDGKIIAVSGAGVTVSMGSSFVFESAAVHYVTTVYDSANDRVVVAYQDQGNGNQGTAVVGVVTDKTISFGTPVVFNAGATKYISACFDSNAEKVFIAYEDDDNSDKGRAVVGTVNPSNNSISFGSEALFSNEVVNHVDCAFDSVNNKVVVVWNDNVNAGAAAVGTISGTSVTFGSIATFEGGNTAEDKVVFHKKSGKVVVSYVDTSDTDNGKLVAGTVSGTSISFGMRNTFDATDVEYFGMIYDPNEEKIVLFYQDYMAGGNSPTKVIVGDVEGTNVVIGGTRIISENSVGQHKVTYMEDVKKIAVLMFDADQESQLVGQMKFVEIIPNTMSLNVTSSYIWDSNPSYSFNAVYHPVQKNLFIGYRSNATGNYGTGVIFQHETHNSTMTTGNFLGFSDAAYSNGQTAKIQIVGSIDDAQTGLTTGKKHYVQPSGGIGLTAYPTLQVEAGLALSDTKIIVKG